MGSHVGANLSKMIKVKNYTKFFPRIMKIETWKIVKYLLDSIFLYSIWITFLDWNDRFNDGLIH